MSKAIFINDNSGTVINVSKNKTKIKILLTKGGIVIARNEGFDKGDKVCFILNAMRTKIIKVIPQLIADVTTAIGSNPTLRSSMDKQPDDIEDDFDEYEFYDEEIIIEEEDDGSRSEITRERDEGKGEAEFIISDGS